jgi:Leucine-rich repeat (LRR) protein
LGYSNEWEYVTSYILCAGVADDRIKLDSLPEFLTDLPRLVHLNLGHTGLKSLPDFMSRLRLESLQLNNNELAEIPEWLGSMTDLKELDLSWNEKITALPQSFTRLCNLEVIDLSRTSITRVPDSIREYKNLKTLHLGGSFELSKTLVIPDWIGELTNLEYLFLGRSIKKIPRSIGNLRKLKRMVIYDNKIKTLPESIGNLLLLKELTIDFTHLRKLPKSFLNLSSLEKLELIVNAKLKRLPESFGSLRSLKELKISCFPGYSMETLPDSFGNLSDLQRRRKTSDHYNNFKLIRYI